MWRHTGTSFPPLPPTCPAHPYPAIPLACCGNIMTGKRSRLKRESAGKATAAVSGYPRAEYVMKAAREMRMGPPPNTRLLTVDSRLALRISRSSCSLHQQRQARQAADAAVATCTETWCFEPGRRPRHARRTLCRPRRCVMQEEQAGGRARTGSASPGLRLLGPPQRGDALHIGLLPGVQLDGLDSCGRGGGHQCAGGVKVCVCWCVCVGVWGGWGWNQV